jgi:hypothetical protein
MEMQTRVVNQGDKVIVQSFQDTTEILDSVKERIDQGNTGSHDMKHAATIPMVIIESYINRTGITFTEFMRDKEHIKALLNDKSLEGFRIWKGKV